jgi:hypothetical protein
VEVVRAAHTRRMERSARPSSDMIRTFSLVYSFLPLTRAFVSPTSRPFSIYLGKYSFVYIILYWFGNAAKYPDTRFRQHPGPKPRVTDTLSNSMALSHRCPVASDK